MSETAISKVGSITDPQITICGYYATHTLKPAEFFKAVRAAKIKAFDSVDLESAQTNLTDTDPDLTRTVALSAGTHTPEAIERWVMDATVFSLRSLDPDVLLPENSGAEATFGRILAKLAVSLRSANKPIRSRAYNLVKLSLNWLIRRRSLDPIQALDAFGRFFENTPLPRAGRSEAQKVLLRANPNQWKALSVVVNLRRDELKEANQSLQQAIRARDTLQTRLVQLEQLILSKDRDLERMLDELKQLRGDLDASKNEVEAQRRLRELDASEAAGRTRNLLTGRLGLLLSDAQDALEFEPPHVDGARQRINAARETIVEEVKRHNG